jgi:hypothetical protein
MFNWRKNRDRPKTSPENQDSGNSKESSTGKNQTYCTEQRPAQRVKTIRIEGALNVILKHGDSPSITVAATDPKNLSKVLTRLEGDTLYLSSEPTLIRTSKHGTQVFHGSIGVVCDGDLVVHHHGRVKDVAGRHINTYVDGKKMKSTRIQDNCEIPPRTLTVGIVMPVIPDIKIFGTSQLAIPDILQPSLAIEISGSGEIYADGRLDHLRVAVSGSGSMNVAKLLAQHADLSIRCEAWSGAKRASRVVPGSPSAGRVRD